MGGGESAGDGNGGALGRSHGVWMRCAVPAVAQAVSCPLSLSSRRRRSSEAKVRLVPLFPAISSSSSSPRSSSRGIDSPALSWPASYHHPPPPRPTPPLPLLVPVRQPAQAQVEELPQASEWRRRSAREGCFEITMDSLPLLVGRWKRREIRWTWVRYCHPARGQTADAGRQTPRALIQSCTLRI